MQGKFAAKLAPGSAGNGDCALQRFCGRFAALDRPIETTANHTPLSGGCNQQIQKVLSTKLAQPNFPSRTSGSDQRLAPPLLLGTNPADSWTDPGTIEVAVTESKTFPDRAPFTIAFSRLRGDPRSMTSLQRHGIHEAHKQLQLRMKKNGLSSIKVHVTRRAGKLQFNFTGSDEEVKKAQKILADWN